MKRSTIKLLTVLMRSCFAALLLMCLLPSLVPGAVIVSAFGGGNTMSCCIGKAAGHCHATLKVSKPKPEPMCGAKAASIDDGITVVADEADEPGSSTAVGRSIQNHCAGDCSSCAVRSSKQLQRHKTHAVSLELPALAISLRRDESSEGFFNPHPEFDPFSPRGPPHSWT